jgi:hypothetical protein
MLTMGPGGYKKRDLEDIIQNINKEIEFNKAPGGRHIPISGNKEPLIQRIQQYAYRYQDDDYFRPYATITPGQFPILGEAGASQQRLPIGPPPLQIERIKGNVAKSNKIMAQLDIDNTRLHTNAGGYSTVELEQKIDAINDAINARRIPGPILVPHDLDQLNMMRLIRQYVLHNLDNPAFLDDDDDVKTGQGVGSTLGNPWHPWASREYYIHYPKLARVYCLFPRNRNGGRLRKSTGLRTPI